MCLELIRDNETKKIKVYIILILRRFDELKVLSRKLQRLLDNTTTNRLFI